MVFKGLAAALLVALGSASTWLILRRSSAAPKTVVEASSATAPSAIVAPGRVEPVTEEILLAPEVSGILSEVFAAEGAVVRSGQLLARLGRAEWDSRIREAKALVTAREADLRRVVSGARIEERREAAAAVREAEAVVDNALTENSRRQSLWKSGDISQAHADLATRDLQVARERLVRAREHLALVEAPAREEDLSRAEADVAAAQARTADLESLSAKTEIRAPVSGRILKRHHSPGEWVSGDRPVFTIGDLSRVRVRTEIDENDVAGVYVGQSAYVTAPAFGGRQFPGEVVQVGSMVGTKSVFAGSPGEFRDRKVLEALILLEDGRSLPSGLRVDAHLTLRPQSR